MLVRRLLVLPMIFSPLVIFTVAPAFGAMVSGSCDSVMQGLAKQMGACPSGTCAFKVENGQLQPPSSSSSAFKIERGEDYSVIRDISKASGDSVGISSIRIKNAADGAKALQVTQRDKNNGELVNEFVLDPASATSCSLVQSSRKLANEQMANVDFDKNFCEAANSAMKDVSPETEKACSDLESKLAEAYQQSSDALIKKGKIFREAKLAERAASIVGIKNSTSLFKQALAQRDHCGKSQMAVSLAAVMENPGQFQKNFASVSKVASQPIGEMFVDWGVEAVPMSRPLNAVPQSSKAPSGASKTKR